ncbi:RecF/RecN/SMC N terminal domain-domain-containing protein [Naematelia encephala]|uniref:RecF/RecN/SMC N terminal domain-domain-containing protein n=1 Tax=Naematelia encephala TaxID=71784 RepID=A0A1Y2BJN9_9TREE|nr:RecF/RecN/SMC N terminal domain-domain-containing protein [Naematelia encephala]
MPPRRTTRVVSSASNVSAAPSTRPSRSRKQPVPSPPLSDNEDGEDSDGKDMDEAPVKPSSRKATGSKGKAKTTLPVRKGTKTSMPRAEAVGEDSDDPLDDAVEQDEPKRGKPRTGKPSTTTKSAPSELGSDNEDSDHDGTHPKARKPVSKKAPVKAPSRARAGHTKKKVILSDSEDEKEVLPPAGRTAEDVELSSEEEDLFPSHPSKGTSVASSKSHLPTPPPELNHKTASPSAERSAGDVEEEEVASEDEANEADETIRLDSPPKVNATPSPSDIPPLPSTSTSIPPPLSGPKPRLTIHKLVLVDFKSYAGRQEIGPFHKSFSAIVGPNGSGKSNTIDALLFVFGYRASKMRQGKLSELIHNSAGKEGLESCSVEVWFREITDLPGVDNFLLVPNSQLVVTRTAYRNNSSKYSINDRTSSFTEVTTLLKGKGIDLDHNRFLILQGEVESIAQMKAKAQNEHEDGLLEYLEDIIGTTKYKQPIEEASQEVETLNDARGEKMNRLRVVEREKAALEEKKREAEDFLRDTNELTRKKSLLWQYHMFTLQNNLEITTKAIENLTAELAEEQERNAGQLAEIDELQNGYNEKLAAFEEVKHLTDALVKDSKKYEKEEVGLQEKKKHLSTKQKKIKKSIHDDGHARSEALAAIENHAAELETTRAKLANLEEKLVTEEAELEEIRDSLRDKTDVFTTQIEAKQRELEPWTAKISEKQSAIDVATSERDLLAEKAVGAQAALTEANAALKALREGDGNKQAEYEGLKKEAVKVKKQLADAEAKMQTMSHTSDQLRKKVSSSRSKADEAKSSLAADKSENAVLSSLNKLKAQGRIKGFHGRLGDLGIIDDKYDVAVTTACSALNNLVVDTVEQGQACIEHLRKGNIGRASFMVLEKLPPRDLGPIETPENVPRLFDLIKPKDARFAPAFYKGVFNTLVADDLVQAQRIGYGLPRQRNA